jgi:hypothetical protein
MKKFCFRQCSTASYINVVNLEYYASIVYSKKRQPVLSQHAFYWLARKKAGMEFPCFLLFVPHSPGWGEGWGIADKCSEKESIREK